MSTVTRGEVIIEQAAGQELPHGTPADQSKARRLAAWAQERRRALTERAEAGLATAEYAIATVAAVGFAGLLLAILRGDEVRGLLLSIVQHALSFGS